MSVQHLGTDFEYVLHMTGASKPGADGKEKRVEDWYGDHESSSGLQSCTLHHYLFILDVNGFATEYNAMKSIIHV